MLLLTLLAQLCLMSSMLLLARFYPPAAIGQLSQLSATLLLWSPVAALCLPLALVVTKHHLARIQLFRFAHFLQLLSALSFGCLVSYLLPALLPFSFILNALLLTLGFYLLSLQQLWQQWALAQSLFPLAGMMTFIGALSLSASRLLSGSMAWSIDVLLLLTLLAPLLVFILTGYPAWRSGAVFQPLCLFGRRALRVLKRHRHFVLWQSPQVLLNSVSMQLPILCIALWYGVSSAGFYSVALAVLAAPAGVVSKPVGDYLYPKLAGLAATARLQLFLRATGTLLLGAAIPLSVFYLYADDIFMLLFGQAWLPAAAISKLMIPWVCFMVANAPALKMLMVQQQQKFGFYLNLVSVVCRLTGLLLAHWLELPLLWSVGWLSLCGVLHNATLIAYVWLWQRKQAKKG